MLYPSGILIQIRKVICLQHPLERLCLTYHVYNKEILNDPQRQSKYKKYGDKLNYTDMTFPVTIRQMDKIENNNNNNNTIIHAFGCENESVSLLYFKMLLLNLLWQFLKKQKLLSKFMKKRKLSKS